MDERRLKVLDAVVRAWTENGSNPDYTARQQESVRAAMPTLAQALDELVMELKNGHRGSQG
ncbi:hypothetical protein ACF3NS_06585 [Arsenicicoccus cauae]|uniref:Uncharacterized protein n=1 Tax=Arsenicicoccus cauae TaxID=2663847 RepID=A0A6I3IDS8_9MICO|nr:hypothetical protein [Arsenicicoccus cauae]MTB72408.1 hypothetical protein [Arsenicicoccus cauae]